MHPSELATGISYEQSRNEVSRLKIELKLLKEERNIHGVSFGKKCNFQNRIRALNRKKIRCLEMMKFPVGKYS